ncbi:glutathione S-transferase N-terminal domain-containing protein [Plastoroseomonas arctica]|uniref:Glutathione S-transferase family protein n=1 Tax=Plastoroseomonas arctica TaxID=1509237 RepID=A0AAF1KHU5_9PROT|nr:glutathione S-transferase N-terminal domain-containing protein [Plastoroseomonas arctica]MBR0653835.1 glutathione S-transferase family protein [Plastoroseomonas arctica]
MQLIGRNLSPFVRRVAATLNLYAIPFEHLAFSTVDDAADIARYNPLVRVPALVLDDGETLIDSAAILDHVETLAPAGQALLPPPGPARRAALRAESLALGACDKGVAALIELKRRAPEHRSEAVAAGQLRQVQGGLAALEAIAPEPYLLGALMTQADVTTAVLMDFLDVVHPGITADYPALSALRHRLNKIEAIGSTRWIA